MQIRPPAPPRAQQATASAPPTLRTRPAPPQGAQPQDEPATARTTRLPRLARRRAPAGARWCRPAGTRSRVGKPLALVVVVSALLASCSTIRVFTDFSEVLRDAGFGDVSVTIDSRGAGVLVISASGPAGDTLDDAHDRAAELAWERFPRRIEGVSITIEGDRRSRSRAQLEEAYGPRDPALDETALTDEVTRFGMTALVAVLIGGLVVATTVAVTVVVVVRSGRRRRSAAGPPTHPPGPVPWAPPGDGTPGPWAPPRADPPPAAPNPTAPAPTTSWAPPADTPAPPSQATSWSPPPPNPAGPVPAHHDDGTAARRLGRRPRGPVPPPEQTPPGWGR